MVPPPEAGIVMGRCWTASEDTAVRLASALDWEHGGDRMRELAERLGRTEGAVRQRATRLRALQLEGAVVGAARLMGEVGTAGVAACSA